MEESVNFFTSNPLLFGAILAWSLFWKGIALWKASHKEHATWFIILLIVNTVGILDIAYIYFLNRYDLGSKKLLAFLNTNLIKKN